MTRKLTDIETFRTLREPMDEDVEIMITRWIRKNAPHTRIGDVDEFIKMICELSARHMNAAWQASRSFHADLPDAQKPPKPSDGKEWVIVKSGHFYRPDRSGYTNEVIAAGLYTKEEALAEITVDPDIMRARHISDYRTEIEAARANVARFDFFR